jgi:acyl-ACP thioesterase
MSKTPRIGSENGPGDRPEPQPLAAAVEAGRRFVGERKIRLGDVDVSGRLRFDALTRYTQDVSDDDTTDAGLGSELGWVVRSTVVDQLVPARLAERLRFVTFCSGVGRSWAERRLSISGQWGARYEVATLWICIDPQAGRPSGLSDQFLELYGPAAAGRRVSPRLQNPGPPADLAPLEQWQLRSADYDVFGHVNNAAYWAPVEQWLPPDLARQPTRARLEYGAGLAPSPDVAIGRQASADSLRLWWMLPGDDADDTDHAGDHTDDDSGDDAKDGSGEVAATVAVDRLPDEFYAEAAL